MIAILVLLAGIYLLGWVRLRRRGGPVAAPWWRLVAYQGGLTCLALALLSALDVYGALLFSAHMMQHLFLMLLAPPLLLWGSPMPTLLWGLPEPLRRRLGRQLAAGAALRRTVTWLSLPSRAWLVYLAVVTAWHIPMAYDAAQGNSLIHDLEHVSFFLSAGLFWWHVFAAAPHLHGLLGMGRRMSYLILAFIHSQILGIALAFAPMPLYPYYARRGGALGWSVLEDQAASGAIMWVPGGIVYGVAMIVLAAAMLDREAKEVAARTTATFGAARQGGDAA
ncbi:MAG: cytochrome c oxidase assembly protein [Ardenticatenia bacterium]|nr:cytochrome c oxidase assembly protein [Ardenticatenia bacterium]